MMTTSVSTAVVVASLTIGYQAWANLDQDDATDSLPRVVPYEGVIDFDGAAYNGTLDMRFTLYDAASGGDAVWTEEWTAGDQRAVQVFSGRFAAALGTFDDGGLRSLEDVIADAGPVYLGVEVKETDEADWVALAGRQRLNPVPYALWSNKASDLDVAGALTVGGALRATGDATFAAIAEIQGADLRLGTNDGRSAGATTTQRALVHAPGADDVLVLNYAGDFEGGTQVQSALTVTGELVTRSNGTVNGNLNVLGSLADSVGALTIDDDLVLKGELSDDNSDLTINDNLVLTGNFYDSNSAVSITDDLTVSGAFTLTGDITDSNGDVVIADGLDVTGANGLDVRGSIHNNDANEAVTVGDDLTVTGDVRLSDCRICFNTKHDNGGDQHHACVPLVAGSNSGWRAWNIDLNDNDQFGLSFLCDGEGASTGTTNVGM